MSDDDLRSSFDATRPLSPTEAKRLLRKIREAGQSYSLSDHAVEELGKADMDMMDVANVLRC